MANGPVRVASIGMGWWSDVLADAIKRSGKIEIASCFTRSDDKRRAFAEKYGCQASPSYEAILADPTIEAIINTTPNNVHLETTRAAAEAGTVGALADWFATRRLCAHVSVTDEADYAASFVVVFHSVFYVSTHGGQLPRDVAYYFGELSQFEGVTLFLERARAGRHVSWTNAL